MSDAPYLHIGFTMPWSDPYLERSTVTQQKLSLHVGLNYPNTTAALKGCVNDALDWSDSARGYGFERVVLTDSEGTRGEMLAHLEGMLAQAEHDSIVLFTYSGHGTRVPDADADEADGWDEALVPHDYRRGGMLSDDTLYELFMPAEARGVRVIFVADSCFSGTINRLAPALSEGYRRPRFLPPSEWMAPQDLHKAAPMWNKAQGKSRRSALTLTGCSDVEVAYDAFIDGKPRGAFTAAALSALSNRPPNYRSWYALIRRLLPSTDFNQTPQLNGSAGQRRWRTFDAVGSR